MTDFFTLILLEVNLILRSKSFWLLAVLTIISLPLLPTLTLLLGQLVLIHSFTRDAHTKFADLLYTLPYTSTRLYLARVIAALGILLALWPFMLGAMSFFPEIQLAAWLFKPNSIGFLTLKYILLCLTQIGLICFFRILTDKALWLYFLAIVCWNVTFAALSSNLGLLPSLSKLFVFGQGFLLPSAPSLAVGYFPEKNIFSGFALFNTGLMLLFLTGYILKEMRNRHEPMLYNKLFISLPLVTLILLFIGSHAVISEINHREHSFNQLIKEANTYKPLAEDSGLQTLDAESYTLAVKLNTTTHYFDGTAIIQGKINGMPSDHITFTLRNCFTVTKIIETTTDTVLDWTQNGAVLTIYWPDTIPPNTLLSLSISYSGEVWEWFPDRMALPSGPVNFIAPEYSLLRSGYAWYPISGFHELYTYYDYTNPVTNRNKTTLRTNYTSHSPVPFTLTVDIDSDNVVASNLPETAVELLAGEYKKRYHFFSARGADVFLLAGPYKHDVRDTPTGKVSIYAIPEHLQQVNKVTDALTKPYDIYSDMLREKSASNVSAEETAYTLVETPSFLFIADDGQPLKNLALTNTITLSENFFKDARSTMSFLNIIRDYNHNMIILRHWWHEDLTDGLSTSRWGNGTITNSLIYYLYIIGLEKSHAPDSYLQARQNVLADKSVLLDGLLAPSLPLSPVTREVFLVLDTLRFELGEETLKKVLRLLYRIYKTQGSLHDDDFIAVVEDSTAYSNLSSAKQTEILEHLMNIRKLTNQQGIIKGEEIVTLLAFIELDLLP